MKKTILLLAGIVALMATSCNQAKIKQLEQENASLKWESQLKDTNMQLLVNTMVGIQTNLNTIKEHESELNQTISANAEAGEDLETRINNDINSIYQLLLDNKEKVKKLQVALSKANRDNKAAQESAQKLIESLQAQIDEQNEQITKLKQMLEEKDIEIGFLNNAIINLSTSVDSLASVNASTTEKLQETTESLETAYYIIASKSDLKAKGIISSDGLFSKKKIMAGDYDSETFTKVNIRNIDEIEILSGKAKVLTNHPESAYAIEENGDALRLVIKDKEAFWSVSKYLVIQTK